MNSSLLRACKARGRYIHVSKPLKTIKFKLGSIEFTRTIVDPKPGVTRFTDPKAWERLGKQGVLDAARA